MIYQDMSYFTPVFLIIVFLFVMVLIVWSAVRINHPKYSGTRMPDPLPAPSEFLMACYDANDPSHQWSVYTHPDDPKNYNRGIYRCSCGNTMRIEREAPQWTWHREGRPVETFRP